jgi:hypothetical protein
MRYWNSVHEENATRDNRGCTFSCVGICWSDIDDMSYQGYAAGGNPELVNFNSVQSAKTTWPTHEP